jgi:hypothetical protein
MSPPRPDRFCVTLASSLDASIASRIRGQGFLRFKSEFVGQILLCFSKIKLINQEKLAGTALCLLAHQERIQGTRLRVWKEGTLPAVLLINDDVEVVEVGLRNPGLLPSFFGKQTIEFKISFFQGQIRSRTNKPSNWIKNAPAAQPPTKIPASAKPGNEGFPEKK